MGFRSRLVFPFAKKISRDIKRWSSKPIASQQAVFEKLIKGGRQTLFGKDHSFDKIQSIKDFQSRVPVRDYEGLRPYFDKVKNGERSILWPGRPVYFAKTSGTTSGIKYIPITKQSLPNHFQTARNALFNFYAASGNGKWMDGKMIFLSGSPKLEEVSGIKTGRLSGIVNHEVPAWLRTNQLPSYETNCIDDWEQKLDRIVAETIDQHMRLISGIPPWVQMYYERLLEVSGKKTIIDLFPNYSVFAFGGVNFEPYRETLEKLTGKPIPSVETYPASEGFIAFQDVPGHPGLLLNIASGIFFEFIPADNFFDESPPRLTLADVEMGVNYAIILNSNAGLWGYNIEDAVEFISTDPYRIIVTGRIKHFISAFGEHVIGKEVDAAMLESARELNVKIIEFTVAPQVNPGDGITPYHEWFIEFENVPQKLQPLEALINKKMIAQNIYYEDLIKGGVLQDLKITPLAKDAFRKYMKSQGKLGGQNKVPRLTNDRKIADVLEILA